MMRSVFRFPSPALPGAAAALAAALAALPIDARVPAAHARPAPFLQDRGQEPEQPPANPDDNRSAREKIAEEEASDQRVANPADDVFFDPVAKRLLENTFPELPAVAMTPADEDRVRAMAAGSGRLDPALLERFVRRQAAELTKRATLDAMLATPVESRKVRPLQTAVDNLLLLLRDGERNAPFLAEYRKKLAAVLQPVVTGGHLHSRVQAAIVLARASDNTILPFWVEQIGDPDQAYLVKLQGFQAIVRATDLGRADAALTGDLGVNVVAALVGFLVENPDAPWPVKVRALEALGSTRLAYIVLRDAKAEAANAALAELADLDNALPARAQAAWALGMMRVPAEFNEYNHALVAHHVGRLAVAIGEEIDRVTGIEVSAAEEDAKKAAAPTRANFPVERVRYLVGLVAGPLYSALAGDPRVQGTGLANAQGAAPHRQAIEDVRSRLANFVRAGANLYTSIGGQVPAARRALRAVVDDLRDHLDKNPPKSLKLVPNGPEFPVANPPAAVGG